MISTHILDLTTGNPAQKVFVTLEMQGRTGWGHLDESETDADGRIVFDVEAERGTYKLTFHIEEYLKTNGHAPFFSEAPIVFNITDTTRTYHIPLLLSAYGYSTYRGS